MEKGDGYKMKERQEKEYKDLIHRLASSNILRITTKVSEPVSTDRLYSIKF